MKINVEIEWDWPAGQDWYLNKDWYLNTERVATALCAHYPNTLYKVRVLDVPAETRRLAEEVKAAWLEWIALEDVGDPDYESPPIRYLDAVCALIGFLGQEVEGR